MSTAVANADPMVALSVLSTPESVALVRGQIRSALECRGLGAYAGDAELIVSELVSNAVRHASTSQADEITVALVRTEHPSAVAIIVIDSSPAPPAMREVVPKAEGGRGLRIIDTLSAFWDWRPEGKGKAVIAVLTDENCPS